MATSTFRLTLQISHPRLSAAEIEKSIALPVRYAQSVGMPRKSKSGDALGGTYDRTNVSFSFHPDPLDIGQVSVEDFVSEKLRLIDANFLNDVFRTGGTSHFLIGIFSAENVMTYFDVNMILQLGSFKVGLKFDFYGGEEP